MKYFYGLLILVISCGVLTAQQTPTEKETDSVKRVDLTEVVVQGTRANERTPVTFKTIHAKELQTLNLGLDLPLLLNYYPSVVSTTFDGTGVGYTDIRVRGSDNSRINVTINGIPYNDADSQTTFFVNLQDFASSIGSVQLQRGVGTSTNGAGAFGASINIETKAMPIEPYAEVSGSVGSFGTQKHTLQAGSGLLNDHWNVDARLSRIRSNGYVDRAFSDLRSYFVQGSYRDDNTLVKGLVFGGSERTGLSFAGQDRTGLEQDRRFNPDGLFVDTDGNTQFYADQTDNYWQDHYQLHLTQQFNDPWNASASVHYTNSRGYFEQMNDDADLGFYRLGAADVPSQTATTADLASRLHLNSEFYGTVYQVNYKGEHTQATLGGSYQRYDGEQFGEVISMDQGVLPGRPFRFYENTTRKRDFNSFLKANADVGDWSLYGDLQFRRITYQAEGTLFTPGAELRVDEVYNFFNPKAGVSYNPDAQTSLYISVARAQREPARVDFENGNPEPERLWDWELGTRIGRKNLRLQANLFYMDYSNQLVLTGERDQGGFPLRTNVGESYRFGFEGDLYWQPVPGLVLQPNLTWSRNRNRDFVVSQNGELANLGDTDISFSPEWIVGNRITWMACDDWTFTFLSKFVGEQFMSNTEAENARLESYFINDFNVEWRVPVKALQELALTLQVNNIFDVQYENNGYYFTFDVPAEGGDGVVTLDGNGFYPQAGINFLTGLRIRM